MKVYLLTGKGDSRNGWKFRAVCGKVFTDPQAAADYAPEFEQSCYNPEPFESAEPGTLKVTVTPLELVGDLERQKVLEEIAVLAQEVYDTEMRWVRKGVQPQSEWCQEAEILLRRLKAMNALEGKPDGQEANG